MLQHQPGMVLSPAHFQECVIKKAMMLPMGFIILSTLSLVKKWKGDVCLVNIFENLVKTPISQITSFCELL